MTDGEKWWKETTRKLRKDPEYLAAGLSLEIATRVNSGMLAASIGQREFAAKLGVSQPYVSQVLAGKTNLTILTLCKLAAALDLSPLQLLGVENRGTSARRRQKRQSRPHLGPSLTHRRPRQASTRQSAG
jgi:transcriptional regulator with XRE-family HTH domain